MFTVAAQHSSHGSMTVMGRCFLPHSHARRGCAGGRLHAWCGSQPRETQAGEQYQQARRALQQKQQRQRPMSSSSRASGREERLPSPSSAIFCRAALSSSNARRRLLFSSMMLSWACGAEKLLA
jgi:hypothetical protein